MSVFKQKKFTSQSGKDYVFQFPGIRSITKINDRIKNKYGVTSDEKLAEEMMSHVIVEPKVSFEYFGEDYSEFSEVIQAAYMFATGQDSGEKVDDQ